MFAERTAWNSEPNRFSLALERLRHSGMPLLDLTRSNPTDCGFTYDEAAIMSALADKRALEYSPVARGLRSAGESVASYYAELSGLPRVSPEQIFLTTSTSEAYSYAFRLLCDPGDEVLIPRPGYPLFDLLAAIQDVNLVPYPLQYDQGWHMDMHALEKAVTPRTRAVVVVHPNNPTGSCVTGNERKRLAEVCAGQGIAIIADEVFLDYGHEITPASFADNSECLTFTLSGLSKIAGLPQMKVAWMVVSGPESATKEAIGRLEVIADTYLSMNAPLQVATPKLLESRHGLQKQLKARLKNNLREMDAQLTKAPNCERLQAEAGWYATLRVPVTQTDEDLAIRLMEEQGVVVHPGHFFDFDREGYLIVSLMTPEADFREGVRRILATIA